MIRISKHRIDLISNCDKNDAIKSLISEYKICLEGYINLIKTGELPLVKNLSSKVIPALNIKHSRYKQLIYKHASEIVRSGVDRAKKKRYSLYKRVYSYFKEKHPDSKFANKKFKELSLKQIIQTRHFSAINIQRVSVGLDERFFNLESGSSFDLFVKIILPIFNEKGTRALQIKVPLNVHAHSINLEVQGFKLKKNIQIKEIRNMLFINLVWEKEAVDKKEGKILGIDLGVNTLIASSDGQVIGRELENVYKKIKRRKVGGKNYRKALTERDNLTNFYVNKLELDGVGILCVEDLKGVKFKKSHKENIKKGKISNERKTKNINRKNSNWIYPQVLKKLERICEQSGIQLVKVSPAYTSQSCSNCGAIHPDSRKGGKYRCIECRFQIDADINAAINIRNKGEIVPLPAKKNKT